MLSATSLALAPAWQDGRTDRRPKGGSSPSAPAPEHNLGRPHPSPVTGTRAAGRVGSQDTGPPPVATRAPVHMQARS